MTTMQMTVVATVALAISVATAQVREYTWDATNPQTAYGSDVTLTLEGPAVKTLVLDASAGDDIVFTGDEMAFADGAALTLKHGRLVCSNDVTTAGALSLATTDPEIVWTTPAGTSLYADQDTVVATGVSLDDYEVASATLSVNAAGTADPFFPVRTAGTLTVQMQGVSTGTGAIKALVLELRQQGADIVARVLSAWYVLEKNHKGDDVTVIGTEQGVPTVAQHAEKCYGCTSLTLHRRTDEVRAGLKVAAAWQVGGAVAIGRGAVLESGASGVNLTAVTGAGKWKMVADSTDNKTVEYVGVPKEKTWTTFAANRRLETLITNAVTARLAGAHLSPSGVDAWVGHWRGDAASGEIRCQMQNKVSSATVKGLMVHFRQNGNDIEIETPKACYCTSSTTPVDFETNPACQVGTVATAADANGYCVIQVDAEFTESAQEIRTYGTSFTCGMTGGAYEIVGSNLTVRLEDTDIIPPSGSVSVSDGSSLLFWTSVSSVAEGIAGGLTRISAGPGGRILQGAAGSVFAGTFGSRSQQIFLDGGELVLGYGNNGQHPAKDLVNTSGSTYLNFLTLSNGSEVSGSSARIGGLANNGDIAHWRVRGTVPSVFGTGISLLGSAGTHGTFLLDVDDVTGSDAVDFTIQGDIKPYDDTTYRLAHVVKSGAGTIRLNGVTTFVEIPTRVEGGTWMLGASGTMNDAQSIVLAGGALASAAETANALDTLVVSNASAIVLAENANLSFKDCSAAPWGTDAALSVTCPDSARLRFGTNAASLTSAQLRAIRFNGRRARLGDDGTLCGPGGLAIIVR